MSNTPKPKKTKVLPARPPRQGLKGSESAQPAITARPTPTRISAGPRLATDAFETTPIRTAVYSLQAGKSTRLDVQGVSDLDEGDSEEEIEIDDKVGKYGLDLVSRNSSEEDEMEGDVGRDSAGDDEDTGVEDTEDWTPSPSRRREKTAPIVPEFEDQEALDAHISRIQAQFNKKEISGKKAGKRKLEKGKLEIKGGKAEVEAGTMKVETGTMEARDGAMIKVEGGAPPTTKASSIQQKALKRTKGAHSLKVMLSLTGLTRAKDAATVEPLHGEDHVWVYFDSNGILVPNFGQSFDENYSAWGDKYEIAVTDPTHMDAPDREVLQAVGVDEFRDILRLGAFATMRDAWKANQDGKGEEREKKRNTTSRHGQRKATKADNRMQALVKSDLPLDDFGFLADPGFQSPSHSDSENDKRLEIQDPSFRSDEVRKLLLSFDKAHNTHKRRTGNPRYTIIEYAKSNVPVPALTKTEGKVPLWAVPKEWLTDNPKLERASRGNIDYKKSQMPHVDKVNEYLHIYEADEREYLDSKESNPELGAVLIEARGGPTFAPDGSSTPSSPLFQPPPSAMVSVHNLAGLTGPNTSLLVPIKPKAPAHSPLQQPVQASSSTTQSSLRLQDFGSGSL
ncbi:hypothetical protein V565_311540, partial [Rhizoctonia solani 123E]